MRIFILSGHMARGAMASLSLRYSRSIAMAGYDVTLVSFASSPPPETNLGQLEHLDLGTEHAKSSVRSLRKAIERWRPDHLISFPVESSVLAAVALQGLVGRRPGHHVVVCHPPSRDMSLAGRARSLAYRFSLRSATSIVAISPASAIAASRLVGSMPIVVIPPPVHIPVSVRWKAPQPPLVSVVGRLATEKRPEFVLEVARELEKLGSAVVLQLVGMGPLAGRIRSAIESENLARRVHLRGFVPDIDTVLSESTALLHVSVEEGFGQVLSEAMAQGTPVVATRDRLGGTSFALGGGVGGLLLPEDTTAGQVAGVLDRLSGSQEELAALSTDGRRCVERFSEWQVSTEWQRHIAGIT